MSYKEKSILTVLRPIHGDPEKVLCVWDPEKDQNEYFNKEELSDFNKINKILNKLDSQVMQEDSNTNLYSHWLDKGWYKSIDYYMASKINIGNESISKSFDMPIKKQNIKTSNDESQKHSIPQALIHRRTKRVFKKQPLTRTTFIEGLKDSLSNIGASCLGYNLYFVIYNIDDLLSGVYLYDYKLQSLALVQEGLFLEEMSNNIQGMYTPKTACFTLILVADFDVLLKTKPYSKGLRETYIEAGIMAQKIIISYMRRDIYSLVTPALRDKSTAKLLQLQEPNFSPLYSLTFGYALK